MQLSSVNEIVSTNRGDVQPLKPAVSVLKREQQSIGELESSLEARPIPSRKQGLPDGAYGSIFAKQKRKAVEEYSRNNLNGSILKDL